MSCLFLLDVGKCQRFGRGRRPPEDTLSVAGNAVRAWRRSADVCGDPLMG